MPNNINQELLFMLSREINHPDLSDFIFDMFGIPINMFGIPIDRNGSEPYLDDAAKKFIEYRRNGSTDHQALEVINYEGLHLSWHTIDYLNAFYFPSPRIANLREKVFGRGELTEEDRIFLKYRINDPTYTRYPTDFDIVRRMIANGESLITQARIDYLMGEYFIAGVDPDGKRVSIWNKAIDGLFEDDNDPQYVPKKPKTQEEDKPEGSDQFTAADRMFLTYRYDDPRFIIYPTDLHIVEAINRAGHKFDMQRAESLRRQFFDVYIDSNNKATAFFRKNIDQSCQPDNSNEDALKQVNPDSSTNPKLAMLIDVKHDLIAKEGYLANALGLLMLIKNDPDLTNPKLIKLIDSAIDMDNTATGVSVDWGKLRRYQDFAKLFNIAIDADEDGRTVGRHIEKELDAMYNAMNDAEKLYSTCIERMMMHENYYYERNAE